VKLLRTIPWFTRLLVGLFLAAQFAGVVSSPRANALPAAAADMARTHHHAQGGPEDGHADPGKLHDHHDHGLNLADTCCALHAYFSGVLPPVIAIETESVTGQSLSIRPDSLAPGVPRGRLDRPPRPLH
jgi:hypothetical protein